MDAEPRAGTRRRSILDRIALFIATAGGAGYSPVAPGTAGSAVTALLLWLVPFTRSGLVLFLLVVVVAGTWAAHRAESLLGGKDPGPIVIDEVAGMTLSVLVFPLTVPVLIAGFFLFRVFDVVKPPPAYGSQKLGGGVGVMIDDLIAGAYALAVLAAARWLVGWP
jgi:phosphatidylglycerophosphatase A